MKLPTFLAGLLLLVCAGLRQTDAAFDAIDIQPRFDFAAPEVQLFFLNLVEAIKVIQDELALTDEFFVDNQQILINGVEVLSPRSLIFLEGAVRFGCTDPDKDYDLVRENLELLVAGAGGDAADEDLTIAIAQGTQNFLNRLFEGATFRGADIVDANNADDLFVLGNIDDGVFVNTDADLKLVSVIAAGEDFLPHGPAMWCSDDTQCLGNRQKDDIFDGNFALHVCQGVIEGEPGVFTLEDAEVLPECNKAPALFNLSWLFGVVVITYVILISWSIYWLIPWYKRRGKKTDSSAGRKAKTSRNDEDQVIINTLATQAASAENLLFQATDMLKQAKSSQNIIAVNSRRELRVLVYVVEYFQAATAMLVALTHQYLDKKTFGPGEKFNEPDARTRALQLEILNYVRDRLQLAFQSDSMSVKSLLRIGEAYAVLKKITDSLVLVGFTMDNEEGDGLGTLKTPFVEINEGAFFIAGNFNPSAGIGGDPALAGQKVCVVLDGEDTRGCPKIESKNYLSNSRRESKVYDADMMMTSNTAVGSALSYSTINSGETGDSLQYFVRTFWGAEVAQIQAEAQTWVDNPGALEEWLKREKKEREEKANPVIKRGPKKKRKKDKKDKKKKKKKNKGYTETDDGQSEYTEYTEASGWSVESTNNYVYNVQSIVNQGLGIAGKAGVPYDKVGDQPVPQGSRFYQLFESYFPNYAEWPKFYTFIFFVMPVIIMIPMLLNARKGSSEIDIDGNRAFKARGAGFGISYLGCPAYYFLDAEIPEDNELIGSADNDVNFDLSTEELNAIAPFLGDFENFDDVEADDRFNNGGRLFISQADMFEFFTRDWNGEFARQPDVFAAEVQSGILAQNDEEELATIRNQQQIQEITTVWIYALMHVAAYFFGMVPLTLIRESLEILSRRLPLIRQIYPMSQWRELHMSMGLGGIFFVTFGATVFLITHIISIRRSTPFSGLAGDPNIPFFFENADNVLWLRELLLPFVPLLLLMKYAARGPPAWMRKYAPTAITKNYWEICYFLHYLTAFAAIIVLMIYRPQVFYWMGCTWGIVWGGNKVIRILRTRRATIKRAQLVSYTVEDKRNNAKKRSDVLRITLNVPASFPSSSRGQACWLTVPAIDYVAHPFTLAKVPTDTEKTIMFHIGVKYLPGDDIISYARPDQPSQKVDVMPTPAADPNALPPNWKSTVDPESGQTYYYNSIEKRTTWTKPKSTAADKLFDGVRGITTRMSANVLRQAASARFGAIGLGGNDKLGANTAKVFKLANRATWTQKFANLGNKLTEMDPDINVNAVKGFPVYVSAPLGTSMDDCLQPTLPGSIIITTQNGLPAAESSVRWLLMQGRTKRPKFHFFVSVSREINDALSVVETLRDAICDSVIAGHISIDGLSPHHAHMCDWLGVYIHLTRRKPQQIEGDREMLMNSLSPPAAPVTPRQLELINNYVKSRVCPGRLPFDRFLGRTQQMVFKRTGQKKLAVGYCGSAKVAYSIRSACRALPEVKFDGEFI